MTFIIYIERTMSMFIIYIGIIGPHGVNEFKQVKIDVFTSTFLHFLLHLSMWWHFNGM
jgi:energy-converting hydrogenase Eha subunit H